MSTRTNSETLAILTQWRDAIESADRIMEPVVKALALQPESPPFQAVSDLQSALTDMTAALIGDKGNWLEWFWTENDMGMNAMEAGPTGKMRKIQSIEDLVWIIGVYE